MIFALPSREARKAWVARVGLGSAPLCLPKKLSWSAVASEVCESVEPIMPNLNGLTPSSCSSLSPSFEPGAGVLVLQHLGLLELGQIEIAFVPYARSLRTHRSATGRDASRRRP